MKGTQVIDLLNAHADRIRAANERHRSEAERIRSKAANDISAELDKLRKALSAVLSAFDTARDAALTAMDAITTDAARDLENAFAEHCVAIGASESLLTNTMLERQHFFATGKLPEAPKMPNVADGPVIGDAANDQIPAEAERDAA